MFYLSYGPVLLRYSDMGGKGDRQLEVVAKTASWLWGLRSKFPQFLHSSAFSTAMGRFQRASGAANITKGEAQGPEGE